VDWGNYVVTHLSLNMQSAIERISKHEAAIAPVNDIEAIVNDPHVATRENIVAVEDDELGGSLRMQNVVGKFSSTPGTICDSEPRLGEYNCEALVGMLGFDEAEVRAQDIELDPAATRPLGG